MFKGVNDMTTAVVTADFKANLKYYFDVAVKGNSVIITRPKKRNAVLISEEEYNELQEIKNKYYLSELEEDNVLLAEALERIQKNPTMQAISENDVMAELGISEEDIENAEDVVIA